MGATPSLMVQSKKPHLSTTTRACGAKRLEWLECRLVEIAECLHISVRLEAEFVHGNVGCHAPGAARAAAAGANGWRAVLNRVEHEVDAGDRLSSAGTGGGRVGGGES